MLTLFKYLRQRAFESVISGVEEAIEQLETDGYFDKLAARVSNQLHIIVEKAAATGQDSQEPQQSGPQSQAAEATV